MIAKNIERKGFHFRENEPNSERISNGTFPFEDMPWLVTFQRDQMTVNGKAVYLYNDDCDGDDTWFIVSGEAYSAKSYDNAWMMLESSGEFQKWFDQKDFILRGK